MLKKYLKNILIGIDQLINALFGGDPDETISSRLGKNYHDSWLESLVNRFFGENHCINSKEEDEGKDAIIAMNKKNDIV